MSKLVIVESPAKAKTIGKMLGKDYIIKASYGHIRDLPERVFGVDIKNGFTPLYEESKARGKNITDLKQTAKKVDEIYLAPDPDREGEAIAWHLYEVLAKANKKAKFHRVAFHEITKNAISKAFQSPGEIDMDRVDAQQARRVLDRIVGYMVSPLLWTRIERGISAGRVQSVALRIVCEREREILAFVPKEYWNFNAIFNSSTAGNYAAKLFRINGDKFEVNAKTDADVIASDVCAVQNWKVADIDTQPRRRYAPPPFITSTLQQAASSALGFSASSTMRIAQQLYEGIDIGVGTAGLITYMRTDAVNIADEARNACREFIRFQYGDQYVPAKPNFFKSKSTAQAAHEAIRPTDVNRTPESLKEYLDPKQYKLYKLIWQRFVACQMAPAEQLRTTVTTEGSAKSLYEFRSTATVTTFPGFLRMYNIQEEGVAQAYVLELVGLENKASRHPGEMSGGEQQRLAIARALVNNPSTIIADEPTGNLDPARSFEIMALLQEINNLGTTVLVVTHEKDLVERFAKRVIAIDEGLVVSDGMEGYYSHEAE